MLNGETLVNWRRSMSFFAARGAAHTITYGRWRVKHWIQKRTAGSFDVDVAELVAGIDPSVISLDSDSASAARKLGEHFRQRTGPAFMFESSNFESISSKVPPEQKETTIRAADRICQNTFDLRGSEPVQFKDSIDWLYSPSNNVDWRWDLNRHTFFETLGRAYAYTGDERYVLKFQQVLEDWLKKNPARFDEPNWSSVFEVACRSNAWIWALYYFRQARTFDADLSARLIAGLVAHARYLDANIELHVPNNHLLLEAKALAFLGILLPEFKEAKKWRERGLELVESQVMEQVCEDGVHGERTTLYHRVIAGELLELFVLMQNNHIAIPQKLMERFARMAEFEAAFVKPDGTFPLLGDSAAADTLLRFSALSAGAVFLARNGLSVEPRPLGEADYWLLGSQRVDVDQTPGSEEYHSKAFPTGGYYLMSAGQGIKASRLVFDCGPFGLKAMPNHGHADALSIELYAHGDTLLVDPGVYSTALGLDWRNYFRGSRSHNTVVVDGLDQSHLMDTRRVFHPADATCVSWISNDEYDFVDGFHNGYERLANPVTHRRQILFAKPYYWVVVDTLTGRGRHSFDLYWHMIPHADVQFNPKSTQFRVKNKSGAGLLIVPVIDGKWDWEVVTGASDPIQGWTSMFSGEKTPAPVLRNAQEAHTPVTFCTVLYPFPAGKNPVVQVSQLTIDRNMENPARAIRVETPEFVDTIVMDRIKPVPTQAKTSETKTGIEFTRKLVSSPLAAEKVKA